MSMTEKQRLIRKVQAATFALVEANLYLDSHPTCKDGLAYFEEHKKHYDQAIKEYEDKIGPLSAFNSNCDKKWEWVTTPFPWERYLLFVIFHYTSINPHKHLVLALLSSYLNTSKKS